jgi:chloramphenicol-sensitive protein RarD
VVVATRRGAELRGVLRSPRRLGWLAASSLLISVNWLVYIWAVQHERIVETTLGYFINPLFSVVLGVAFMHERIGRVQTLAIVIAALGVLNELVRVGVVPWVGLGLALTFGLYGFVRKRVAVDSIVGLGVETALLAPFALAGLGVMTLQGTLIFGTQRTEVDLGLAAAGVVTAIPLVCFAAAAVRLPLSILGVLQYLSPSLALLIAVFAYGELFTSSHAVTFGCIWSGLVLFSASALHSERERRGRLARGSRATGVV